MTSPAFVARMAWREGRAAARRLLLLTVAVAAGVAALVAINSFTDNLRESVNRQAQALLGADLAFQGRRALPPRVDSLIDSLGGRVARTVTFAAMTYVPRTTGARLAQMTAVTGDFPFYGEIATEPAEAWARLQLGRHTVVDPSLLAALGAEVGDSLAVGETAFAIIGTILSVPGDVGVRSAFGPRIFVAGQYLDETGLLGFGARAEHEAFLALPDAADAQAIAEHYRPELRPERIRIRTVADDRERLDAALTRLGDFLGLVALVALLLGGLGVASAVHVFIRQKLDTVAVLRCLGATSGQVFAVYLVQAVAMGLLGSVTGAALGLLIQQALPSLLADLIPVDVVVRPSWRSVAMGVGTGLWVAFVFALLPLLSIRRIPPLAALRRAYEPEAARPRADLARVLALALLAASVVVLAGVQAGNWMYGLLFSGSIVGAIALLGLAALLLIRLARRRLPPHVPYVWRQGVANLHRPANQTTMVVLAIGFGAFLLATLFLVQRNLLSQLDVSEQARPRPNFVLFDIQPNQAAGLDTILASAGVPPSPPVPIVPMRILSLRGVPVATILADTGAADTADAPPGWALRREYRSTYRDSLTDSERLIAGGWWPRSPAIEPGDSQPVDISVEQELAQDLGVGLGDEIVWDIQGVPLRSRVRSLRAVDWARFEPNFFVVFAPGALERAPHTLVELARIDDPAVRGRVQRSVAERFPNITSLDLTLLQAAIEQLVGRVSLAIRFMAFFSLATGVLVLVGAVATSRYQRVREGALLKTLGATRGQVFRVVLAEYLALGLLAAVAAVGLSAAAGWALARFLFEVPFAFPASAIAGVVILTTLLTVTVGLWGSVEVVRKTPLEVLRAEG